MSHNDADLSYTPPLMAPKMKDMDTKEELMETLSPDGAATPIGAPQVLGLAAATRACLGKEFVSLRGSQAHIVNAQANEFSPEGLITGSAPFVFRTPDGASTFRHHSDHLFSRCARANDRLER